MSKNKKDKHHILPQIFLKRFTREDGQLHRLRINVPWSNAKQSFFPAAIGYEKNFYEIKNEVPNVFPRVSDPLYVEDTVNQSFENRFDKCWQSLEGNKETISIEEKIEIIEIIIHLRLRNQNIRRKVFSGEGIEKLHKDFEQNAINDLRSKPTFDPYRGLKLEKQLIEYFKNAYLTTSNGADLHNQFLATNHQGQSEQHAFVVEKHLNSRWIILLAHSNENFILGDNPGLVKNAPGYEPLTGPFEFFFPINSSRYLYMYNDGSQLEDNILTQLSYMNVDSKLVATYNEQSVWDASEYIYGKCSRTLEESKRLYDAQQKL